MRREQLAPSTPPDSSVAGERLDDVAVALRRLGYGEPSVHGALGRHPATALAPGDVPLLARAVEGRGDLEIAIRTFLLGLPVDAADLERALGPGPTGALRARGILSGGTTLRSRCQVLPYRDRLWLGDFPRLGSEDGQRVAATPSTQTLASLVPRGRVGRALDLGTGNGLHACEVAAHADHVVATDVDEGALAYARMNAALNQVDNVDFRLGSWFEPLDADSRYDLIVANLPYVVAPDTEASYQASGEPLDHVTRHVLEHVPELLAAGGTAVVLGTWALREREEWPDPLEVALRDQPVTALALRYSSHSVLDYAAEWNHWLRLTDAPAFDQRLTRWLSYYALHGVRRLDFGAIVLRKSGTGRGSLTAIDVARPPSADGGRRVEQLLRAAQFLEVTTEEELAEVRLTMAPGIAFSDPRVWDGSAWRPGMVTLHEREGLGLSMAVPGHLRSLVKYLGRAAPARDLVRLVATGSPEEAREADEAAWMLIGDLIRNGFVLPETT